MEPTIECRELFARLGEDELLVIDCRSREDWNLFDLQIPGALALSLEELLQGASALPDDELLVLCDTSPHQAQARTAFGILRAHGLTPVILQGGLLAWLTAGLPTEAPETPWDREWSEQNGSQFSGR
jgi:rhodanese-related sulfurtransferase